MQGQMTLYDIAPTEAPPAEAWRYDEDNGMVMCRCPKCGGRMMIGFYTYWNPYHYCPYCGEKLAEGRFVSKAVEVYGRDRETMEQVRKEYGHE